LSRDYKFATTSDTEVLLYAYKKYGVELTKHIKGMYAFAVYDKRVEKMFLFRDPMGIKPLYYYDKNGFFIFSSELKGITNYLKSKRVSLDLNEDIFSLYFTMGYIPSPHTLYRRILKLEPGCFLTYDLNKKQCTVKKSTMPVKPKVGNEKDLFSLIESKILGHLVSDVPVGVFFSGGTDSSLIASVLHKNNINLETFSIKMSHKKEDEKYFNKINEHLKLTPNIYNFSVKEFDDVFYEVISKLDEPIYDSSIFPTYYISKMASQKVKVVLSGEGGDEFFYGYNRSLVLNNLKEYKDILFSIVDNIYYGLPKFKGKNALFKKIFISSHQPISFYINEMSANIENRSGFKVAKKIFGEKIRDVTDLDKMFYLRDVLLRKTDLATSYNSVEGRVPLLDIDIINATEQFSGILLKDNEKKYLLKKMLTNYLPEELVYRSKSGFGMPIREIFAESKIIDLEIEESINYLKHTIDLDRHIDVKQILFCKEKRSSLILALIALQHSIKNTSF